MKTTLSKKLIIFTLLLCWISITNTYGIVTDSLYLTGSAAPCGWTNTNPIGMKPVAGKTGVFSWQGTLKAGEFKFLLKKGTWNPSVNPLTPQVIIQGKTYTMLTTNAITGDYKFTVNEEIPCYIEVNATNLTLILIEKYTKDFPVKNLYLTGSAAPCGWTNTDAIAMTPVAGKEGVFAWEGPLKTGEFKFLAKKGSWSPSVNPVNTQNIMPGNTYNLDITNTITGDYKFNVNKPVNCSIEVDLKTWTTTITEKKVLFLVGEATPNGWDNTKATPMENPSNNIYTWTGWLRPGNFKFITVLGTWESLVPTKAANENITIDQKQNISSKYVGDYRFNTISGGNYSVTVNLTDSTLLLDKQDISPTVRKKSPPMMGWSSWNTYGINISESLIEFQADAMISTGLKDVGYGYINIDDGYFGGRDANGDLLIHPTRFPNGIKTVVDYIHSLGLRAGIYTDSGVNTCAFVDPNTKDQNGKGVGLWGHERKDLNLFFNTWGFDFVKVDFCGISAINSNYSLTDQERYTMISQTIDSLGRTDVSINVCRWGFPGVWVKDVAESWRVSDDIYLSWNSIVNNISKNLYLSAYAGYGRYNDMDMLEIGRGLSADEEDAHFGMWCIMSSPLIIGCDLTKIPQRSLDLIKNTELIAINQDTLGLQASVVQHNNDCYVLAKDIKTLRGLERAVALYNPSEQPSSVTVPFSALELSGNVTVRDLVKHKELGVYSEGSFTATVPKHGALILSVKGEFRLEPELYEAEWATLNNFQPRSNDYAQANKLETGLNASLISGGAKIRYLGNSSENYAQWDDVYSEDGGDYTLSIAYVSGEDRNLTVTINDKVFELKTLNSRSWTTSDLYSIDITLNKGYNTIRMGNAVGWAPDIDCFKLKKNVQPINLKASENRLKSATAISEINEKDILVRTENRRIEINTNLKSINNARLITLQGIVIDKTGKKGNTFYLGNNLPNGIYLVEMTGDGQHLVRKVIIK